MDRPVGPRPDANEPLWPLLLRIPTLALRPSRVGLALITLVVIGLIGSLSQIWRPAGAEPLLPLLFDRETDALLLLAEGLWQGDANEVRNAARALLGSGEFLFKEFPVSTIVLGPVMLAAWAIGGTAISRGTADEFALGVRTKWVDMLAFGLSHWRHAFGAMLAPIALIGVGYVCLAVSGWALLTLPVVNVLGAALLGPAILLSLGLAALGVGFALAKHLIIPAVACDGADVIDAIQRAYAYTVSRPLKLAFYLVLGGLIGAAALAATALVVAFALSLVQTASMAWIGPDHAAHGIVTQDAETTGTWSAAQAIATFWVNLLQLAVLALAVSIYHCGSTVVYLLVRQVVDGQHHRELWTPGAVPGATPTGPADAT
ncbi:MAG: hypothetical protein AAGG07_04900 [Planctomycetota bacterium]